jgi:hypothetical protein
MLGPFREGLTIGQPYSEEDENEIKRNTKEPTKHEQKAVHDRKPGVDFQKFTERLTYKDVKKPFSPEVLTQPVTSPFQKIANAQATLGLTDDQIFEAWIPSITKKNLLWKTVFQSITTRLLTSEKKIIRCQNFTAHLFLLQRTELIETRKAEELQNFEETICSASNFKDKIPGIKIDLDTFAQETIQPLRMYHLTLDDVKNNTTVKNAISFIETADTTATMTKSNVWEALRREFDVQTETDRPSLTDSDKERKREQGTAAVEDRLVDAVSITRDPVALILAEWMLKKEYDVARSFIRSFVFRISPHLGLSQRFDDSVMKSYQNYLISLEREVTTTRALGGVNVELPQAVERAIRRETQKLVDQHQTKIRDDPLDRATHHVIHCTVVGHSQANSAIQRVLSELDEEKGMDGVTADTIEGVVANLQNKFKYLREGEVWFDFLSFRENLLKACNAIFTHMFNRKDVIDSKSNEQKLHPPCFSSTQEKELLRTKINEFLNDNEEDSRAFPERIVQHILDNGGYNTTAENVFDMLSLVSNPNTKDAIKREFKSKREALEKSVEKPGPQLIREFTRDRDTYTPTNDNTKKDNAMKPARVRKHRTKMEKKFFAKLQEVPLKPTREQKFPSSEQFDAALTAVKDWYQTIKKYKLRLYVFPTGRDIMELAGIWYRTWYFPCSPLEQFLANIKEKILLNVRNVIFHRLLTADSLPNSNGEGPKKEYKELSRQLSTTVLYPSDIGIGRQSHLLYSKVVQLSRTHMLDELKFLQFDDEYRWLEETTISDVHEAFQKVDRNLPYAFTRELLQESEADFPMEEKWHEDLWFQGEILDIKKIILGWMEQKWFQENRKSTVLLNKLSSIAKLSNFEMQTPDEVWEGFRQAWYLLCARYPLALVSPLGASPRLANAEQGAERLEAMETWPMERSTMAKGLDEMYEDLWISVHSKRITVSLWLQSDTAGSPLDRVVRLYQEVLRTATVEYQATRPSPASLAKLCSQMTIVYPNFEFDSVQVLYATRKLFAAEKRETLEEIFGEVKAKTDIPVDAMSNEESIRNFLGQTKDLPVSAWAFRMMSLSMWPEKSIADHVKSVERWVKFLAKTKQEDKHLEVENEWGGQCTWTNRFGEVPGGLSQNTTATREAWLLETWKPGVIFLVRMFLAILGGREIGTNSSAWPGCNLVAICETETSGLPSFYVLGWMFSLALRQEEVVKRQQSTGRLPDWKSCKPCFAHLWTAIQEMRWTPLLSWLVHQRKGRAAKWRKQAKEKFLAQVTLECIRSKQNLPALGDMLFMEQVAHTNKLDTSTNWKTYRKDLLELYWKTPDIMYDCPLDPKNLTEWRKWFSGGREFSIGKKEAAYVSGLQHVNLVSSDSKEPSKDDIYKRLDRGKGWLEQKVPSLCAWNFAYYYPGPNLDFEWNWTTKAEATRKKKEPFQPREDRSNNKRARARQQTSSNSKATRPSTEEKEKKKTDGPTKTHKDNKDVKDRKDNEKNNKTHNKGKTQKRARIRQQIPSNSKATQQQGINKTGGATKTHKDGKDMKEGKDNEKNNKTHNKGKKRKREKQRDKKKTSGGQEGRVPFWEALAAADVAK